MMWLAVSMLVMAVFAAVLLLWRMESARTLFRRARKRLGKRAFPRMRDRPYRIVPDQYPTIGEAFAVAVSGDHILVRPGIYRETVDFGGKDVTVSSEDPRDPEVVRSTIIASVRAGPVVLFASEESELACLEGFTVTGGSGVLVRRWSVLGPGARAGGGIFIGPNCSPILRHNVIEGNCADLGGGVYVSSSSLTLLEHNLIRRNRAVLGGGVRVAGDFLRTSEDSGRWRTRDGREVLSICASSFVKNHAHMGGGMSISRGAVAHVHNCYFAGNTAEWDGGGIAVWDSASPLVARSWFVENSCGSDYGFGGGVSIINNCRPRLEHNLFRANSAHGLYDSGGGAIAVNRSQAHLSGNTAGENSAARGRELYAWGGSDVRLIDNEIPPSGILCLPSE